MAKNGRDNSRDSLKHALKDAVREELEDAHADGELRLGPNGVIFPGDEKRSRAPREFELGKELKSHDEVVIDELLASVPRNQGYYLKLYKEKAPNEFELKSRIDNYDSWSDMEWEVTSIVRQFTAKSPQLAIKWGSGRYRIIIWRDGGLRGPKYKPIDFVVDAQEPEQFNNNNNNNNNGNGNNLSHVDIEEKVRSQVATLGELVKTLQSVNPTTSPDQVQKLLGDSFKAGVEINKSANSGESSTMGAVLAAMIQNMNRPVTPQLDIAQLITALATLFNKPTPDLSFLGAPIPVVDPIDQLIKLRAAGIIPTPTTPPPDDMEKTLSMVTRLADLANLFGRGNGDSSPVTELIRTIGPQVGKVVSDITGSINKMAESNTRRVNSSSTGKNTEKEVQQTVSSPNSVSKSLAEQPQQINSSPNSTEASMLPVFLSIKTAIETNDIGFYPQLGDLIVQFLGENKLAELVDGTLAPKLVLSQVAVYGGPFFLSYAAELYLGEFIKALNEQQQNEIIAECLRCDIEYVFNSTEELTADPLCPQCGTKLGDANANKSSDVNKMEAKKENEKQKSTISSFGTGINEGIVETSGTSLGDTSVKALKKVKNTLRDSKSVKTLGKSLGMAFILIAQFSITAILTTVMILT